MEHLRTTCMPKKGVGTPLSVSTFNHERMPVPVSCLQQLNTLKTNIWTNNIPCHCEHGVLYGTHCISYIHCLVSSLGEVFYEVRYA